MPDTTQRAIADVLVAIEDATPAAPAFPTREPATPREPLWRPLTIAAASFAAVVLFVGFGILGLIGDRQAEAPHVASPTTESPSEDGTPTTVSEQAPVTTITSIVATTAAPVDVVGTVAGSWTITPLPESGQAMGLTRLDEEFVGLFYRDRGVEVWASTDGSHWEHGGRIDSHEYVHVEEVVSFEGQTVAVGAAHSDDGAPSEAVVWKSSDGGRTWDTFVLGDGFAIDVAVTPLGLVAVGGVRGPEDPDVVINHAAVWLSDDGETWRQGGVADDRDGESSHVRAVVWDGELKMLGFQGPHGLTEASTREEPAAPSSVTWTSPDGMEWSDAVPSNLEGFVASVEPSPFGIVATTYWSTREVKDNSAVWISANGFEWNPVELNAGGWEFTGVAETDGTVRVVGFPTMVSELDELPRLWTTTDGLRWAEAEIEGLPSRSRVQHVEASSNLVVLAGEEFETIGGAFTATAPIALGE
ncbi:MAG: sialidase family protein [Actinomycetota bacterium]